MGKVLSPTEVKQLTGIIENVRKKNKSTAPTEPASPKEDDVMVDPGLEALFDAEAKLSLQMVDPVIKVVRGKRGTDFINQTLESLNAVRDMIKDKKTWKTRHRI